MMKRSVLCGVVVLAAFGVLADEAVSVGFRGRRAFVRGEADAAVTLVFRGVPVGTVASVEQVGADGSVVRRTEIAVPAPASDGTAAVPCPVETRVSAGWRDLRVRIGAEERKLTVGIGPRHADRMTALIWIGYYVEKPWKVGSFGFTHLYDLGASDGHKADNLTPAQRIDHLDHALANGVEVVHSLPTAPMDDQQAYARRDRKGKMRPQGKKKHIPMEVSHPAMRERFAASAEQAVAELGGHPAFAGMLPCSELRDKTFPSFNTEHERYRRETGREVPAEVDKKVLSEKVARRLYPDGIVPDDDPILAYYRWFWKGGDGWPAYLGAAADVYRKGISRPDFFSFWDPAVRCPPIWGSGGNVDMLNQWVYANPEPMNVAGPAEEILAMAAGRPGQQPAIMTQLICYRSRMAPTNVPVARMPPGLLKHPRADFPTIPPDALQEATWSMIAKPVKAIMYHGWRTVCETGKETGYCYTNPKSAKRLKRLLKDIVAPLGPTLKNLGREQPSVAVLESFTSCVMGAPFSWGWEAQPLTMLQRARLDPRVVYEETILRDGFDDIKVLYAPQCRFLTPTIVAKLREFQAKGGILVADETLPSVLKPDILVPGITYRRPPVSDHTEDMEKQVAGESKESHTAAATRKVKADMIAISEKVRDALKGRYAPRVDSSSPEIVTYSRAWKGTDYVFAINDKRTFGDYVGQWGLIMEKGLPMSGTVTVDDPDGKVKAVYELSRGGRVPFTHAGGRVNVPVKYDTNDGRLFVFLDDPVASLKVSAPETIAADGTLTVRLEVRGESGNPIRAILPVEIRLYDAAGKEIDGAGYLAAKDGVAEVAFLTNRDDAKGAYRLVCRDRASGLERELSVGAFVPSVR